MGSLWAKTLKERKKNIIYEYSQMQEGSRYIGAFYSSWDDAIKENNKQKCEIMRNLHYLKDIAWDAFESRKVTF